MAKKGLARRAEHHARSHPARYHDAEARRHRVVRALKQDAATRAIPVILVTAKADTRDVVEGLDAGGDDYLTKPFDHTALLGARALDAAPEGSSRHRRRPGKPSRTAGVAAGRRGTNRWSAKSPNKSARSSGSAGCGGFCRRRSPISLWPRAKATGCCRATAAR